MGKINIQIFCYLVALPGIRKRKIGACYIKEASENEIKNILEKGFACTSAGGNGAINIWKTDGGVIRGEAMRNCHSLDKKEFSSYTEVAKWAKQWIKIINNNMVQFTTQVATSIEQSQQLIKLGVKPETADLVYRSTKPETGLLGWKLQLCPPSLEDTDNDDIPAWSLARLLELLPYEIPCDKPNVLYHPELIKYKDGYNFSVCRYTVDCFSGTPIENSPFDSCVSMIKWLIAKGYFSKEYLCNIKQE